MFQSQSPDFGLLVVRVRKRSPLPLLLRGLCSLIDCMDRRVMSARNVVHKSRVADSIFQHGSEVVYTALGSAREFLDGEWRRRKLL